jgi:transposase
MYQVTLDEAAAQELRRRSRQHGLAPRTRDRLEMVRLSGASWSIPKIARHLQLHEQTVRTWIKAYLTGGFNALDDQPHVGQSSAITPAILAQVRRWTQTDERTWNAPQIAAEAAKQFGLVRSLDQWRRLLRRDGLTYKRTRRSLRHKQKPELVARKRADLQLIYRR